MAYLVVGVVDHGRLPFALVVGVVNVGPQPFATPGGRLTGRVGHLWSLPLTIHVLVPGEENQGGSLVSE